MEHDPIKPMNTEKIESINFNHNEKLTSVEIGKLWVTYIGNTMAKCVLLYFLQHVNDQDIKKVLENALHLSESLVKSSKEVFIHEDFPIPTGFTEDDVNVEAPRLFSDEFYLHYLQYTIKAGLAIYPIAIPIIVRKDIRDFFIHTIDSTVELASQVIETMKEKGILVKPPMIPIPKKNDFVKKQSYLRGFFGPNRPLHSLEITHLFDAIEDNVTSKGLLTAFSQTAESKEIQKFMQRGKELTHKHIEIGSHQLHKNDLPSPPLLDDLITTSKVAPFSDKLMLWHKIDMFSMKIRTYANGASLNGRRDIGAMYAKFIMDVSLFVEDGANLMIDHGWMEQPPGAIDREGLAKG